MSMHQLNLDAIQMGARAAVAAYPDEPDDRVAMPPRSAHAVLWMDDWWRGATLARDLCERVDRMISGVSISRHVTSPEQKRRRVRELAFGATDEELAELTYEQVDAWDALSTGLLTLEETGDPTRDNCRCDSDQEGEAAEEA